MNPKFRLTGRSGYTLLVAVYPDLRPLSKPTQTSVPLPQRLYLGVKAAQHEPVLLLQEPHAVLEVGGAAGGVAAHHEPWL